MHGSTKNSKEGLEFEAILLHTGIYLSGVGSKLRTRGGEGGRLIKHHDKQENIYG